MGCCVFRSGAGDAPPQDGASVTWAGVAGMAAELHFTGSMLEPNGARSRLGVRR